ncbi:MAG: hypothetical protein HY883_06185 [Deltaproteobacteria bacterium]|nr:hypothetical protein [Deltaproteobacteria bacterium]
MSGNPFLKTAVLIFSLLLLPFIAYGQDNTLNILYTGAVRGELEPCGCSPKTESGGVARLSGYIARNREGLRPYVLIDAGNSTAEDTPQGRLKTEALLNSFGIMGYDAAAFLEPASPRGVHDALTGGDLSPLIEKYGVPAISDYARDRSSVSVLRGPLRINISADPKGYKKGMFNILLTGKPVSEVRTIEGWDVIAASSGEILEQPVTAGKTVIVSGYPKGEKLGILTIHTDVFGVVSGFVHRWQPLGKDIEEDSNVRDVLNEYDRKVASLVDEEEKGISSNGPYLGGLICAVCHQPFMDGWKNTGHAGAFAALEKAGKSRDPECVKCHTVGYGEEGGFSSGATTPGLANVQCEACHGPGKGHVSDFTMPMRPVGEEVCLRCHTRENSPDFDFKTYFEKIRHK